MNKQYPGKGIGWCDYTWNPIKGLCPIGCWYCYGRAMYRRFKLKERLRFPVMNHGEFPKEPSKIFVCSTMEIFHPEIPPEWRDNIFSMIRHHYKHTFQILTKMPENIDRPMPDNVWLGVSVTGNTAEDNKRADYFGYFPRKAKTQFISYEPVLEMPVYNIPHIDWIILGRLTGYGKKHNPKKEWIEKIITSSEATNTPIFLKNNLKEIWGEKLIQEFPDAKM